MSSSGELLRRKSETMYFRIFPAGTRGCSLYRSTLVVFDMEGYSKSEIPNPCLLREKIKRILANDGHDGQVDFSAFVTENSLPKKVEDEFMEARIPVKLERPGGSKVMKLNMMLVQVLHWALHIEQWYEPSNVLILSKSIDNIEQDANFSKFRALLRSKDFHVALSELHEFLAMDDGGSPDIQCGSCSEFESIEQ